MRGKEESLSFLEGKKEKDKSKLLKCLEVFKSDCYRLNICVLPKIPLWKPNPQCDGIRMWDPGEVVVS